MQASLNIIKLDLNDMKNQFEAKVKKWGNSLGIVIPKEIVESQGLREDNLVNVILLPPSSRRLEKLFGTLKTNLSTEEILEEDLDDD